MATGSVTVPSLAEILGWVEHGVAQHHLYGGFWTSHLAALRCSTLRETVRAANPSCSSAPQSSELEMKLAHLHTLPLLISLPQQHQKREETAWVGHGVKKGRKRFGFTWQVTFNWARMFYNPRSGPSSTSTLSKCHLPRRKKKKKLKFTKYFIVTHFKSDGICNSLVGWRKHKGENSRF